VASIDAPSRTPGPFAKPARPRGGLISSADAAEPDAAVLAQSSKESDLFIQVGAFASRDNADRLRGQLAGLGPTTVSPGNFDGRVLHRVRLGPLASIEVADSLLDRLIRSGYTSARLIVETD
jgi:rare lipoprotein A